MDVSPEYIKMCERAEEIQKLWQPKVWDFVLTKDYYREEPYVWCLLPESIADSGVYGSYVGKGGKLGGHPEDILCWLPTQEQLQGIVFKDAGVQTICTAIDKFSRTPKGCAISISGSMNQLWLAFVQWELYHEVWSIEKEEWINKEGKDGCKS